MKQLPGILLLLVAFVAGCGGDDTKREAVIDPGDGGNYAPAVNPADFVQSMWL